MLGWPYNAALTIAVLAVADLLLAVATGLFLEDPDE